MFAQEFLNQLSAAVYKAGGDRVICPHVAAMFYTKFGTTVIKQANTKDLQEVSTPLNVACFYWTKTFVHIYLYYVAAYSTAGQDYIMEEAVSYARGLYVDIKKGKKKDVHMYFFMCLAGAGFFLKK